MMQCKRGRGKQKNFQCQCMDLITASEWRKKCRRRDVASPLSKVNIVLNVHRNPIRESTEKISIPVRGSRTWDIRGCITPGDRFICAFFVHVSLWKYTYTICGVAAYFWPTDTKETWSGSHSLLSFHRHQRDVVWSPGSHSHFMSSTQTLFKHTRSTAFSGVRKVVARRPCLESHTDQSLWHLVGC